MTMISTKRLRRVHRLLGVAIGLQILCWTVSGIYFAWTDIDEIRGDHLRSAPPPIAFERDWIAPGQIRFEAASLVAPPRLSSLELITIAGEPYYRLRSDDEGSDSRVTLASARTGEVRGPLDRDEAASVARASFAPDAEILDVVRITTADVGPHHEYRGRPLPSWRVRFLHDSATHVYVSANEAEVVTHRNRGWRVFDALWMLHTMDFAGRDDFNNPLLRGVSVLALATTLSGYLMWYRTRPRRRPRSAPR
jgi:hypothetical protein